MLFTGTFKRSVDENQRVAIPKRLRNLFDSETKSHLIVAPGTDGSLALYTETGFSDLASRLGSASPTKQDVRAFSRVFYAQAERVELDGQGRVRLPAELLHLAGLKNEAILVGVGNHLELWEPTRWEAYLAEKQDRYDEIAERAFGSATED